MDSIHDSLEQQVKRAQYPEQKCLKEWAPTHNLSTEDGTHWFKGTAMVVVENNNLRRGVIALFHDHKASGHPGITKTLQLIAPYYWWPNMKTFVTEYMLRSKTFKGATCTNWLQRFWSSIIEGNADCDSKRRSKANP